MIYKEEFSFSDVQDYLEREITLVIVGDAQDERSKFIRETYKDKNCTISLDYQYENRQFIIRADYFKYPFVRSCSFHKIADVIRSIPGINLKNILVDITSLQHPSIMCLIRSIALDIRPSRVFTAYIKPEKYLLGDEFGRYDFSTVCSSPSSIPGFVTRSKLDEILVPFLGFEGNRLEGIIGEANYSELIPIIGFPADEPTWQFETLRNSMTFITSHNAEKNIRKCKSGSIFDAYELLENIIDSNIDRHIVVAPIGTRPHTVASALFSLKHSRNCRLIYDFVIERESRSKGIRDITITHLSSFI